MTKEAMPIQAHVIFGFYSFFLLFFLSFQRVSASVTSEPTSCYSMPRGDDCGAVSRMFLLSSIPACKLTDRIIIVVVIIVNQRWNLADQSSRFSRIDPELNCTDNNELFGLEKPIVCTRPLV
jgi:hypothetical protein